MRAMHMHVCTLHVYMYVTEAIFKKKKVTYLQI